MRRATLLAREFDASVTILHAIDDDQPELLINNEREVASKLLSDQARSLREIDDVSCDHRIVLGDPFEGIAKSAEEIDPDILVIGPHRRQALKDIFTGTTAERTIRTSNVPVLMANGAPTGPYRHILIAVDFSDCSSQAVRTVQQLGLAKRAAITVIHVFDAPGTGLIAHSTMTDDEARKYIAGEESRAGKELAAFLNRLEFAPAHRVLKFNETSAGERILSTANELSADLIVVGTHGRTGLSRLMLGSVAEEVLRSADHDVLAVHPRRGN